jgi:hypothetical protein
MAQTTINEVDVLRFFELESRDRAEAVFNIVADKMRTRLQGDDAAPAIPCKKRRCRVGNAPTAQAEKLPVAE